MATRRQTLLEAAKTALDAVVAFVTVDRNRQRTLKKTEVPAASIYNGTESVDYDTQQSPRVLRSIRWKAALRAIGDDAVLEPLHAATVAAVMADDTLGGIAIRTRELGTVWLMEEGDQDYIGCDIEFESVYHTHEADEEVAG